MNHDDCDRIVKELSGIGRRLDLLLILVGLLALALSLTFLTGCTTSFDTHGQDVSQDAPDAPESIEDTTPADPRPDPRPDPENEPDEPETPPVDGPCGGPDEDCDGDGWTPAEGDCCDELAGVNPGHTSWEVDPYMCPDQSWDWDCSGAVEVEQAEIRLGLGRVNEGGCVELGHGDCLEDDAEGWITEPVCGEENEYEICIWSSNPYTSYCNDYMHPFEGVIRCR